MKAIFRNFLKRLIVLSVVLLAISIVQFFVLPKGNYTLAAPFIVLFFFMVTGGLYYMLLKSSQDKFSRFVSQFMIITFAKLFLYVAIIVAYAFINKPDAVAFILTFFIVYLFYTVFEILAFLNDQKKIPKQG